MDLSDMPINLESLEMSKKRDKKVYITDIAIDKVPLIEYYGFTDERNQIMQELARNVLVISKESNDSNEVALTCDLGKPDPLHNFGVALGSEHDVDVLSDTLSNHMIVSSQSVAVVLLHNHPSTQTFFTGGCAIFCSASYAYSDSSSIESGNSSLSETR